jgi:catechol 2,3-dioxygenase-like lactoylglutathione lyase family enzyme
MDTGLTNCIALGVPDKIAAARLYEEAFGFEVVKETEEWIELKAGVLRLFLCEDQVREPAFSVTVEDVQATSSRLLQMGLRTLGTTPRRSSSATRLAACSTSTLQSKRHIPAPNPPRTMLGIADAKLSVRSLLLRPLCETLPRNSRFTIVEKELFVLLHVLD